MIFVQLPSRKKRSRRLWATPALAILAILVFIWCHGGQDDPAKQSAWLRWSAISAGADWRSFWREGRVLTLFTALFIHAGVVHLIGNGLFLLIFGAPEERAIGPWRLLALFLIGGALANLAAVLLTTTPGSAIVGASGGVSALIGAYVVLFPRARLGIALPLGLWLEFVRAPAALLIGLWAALQLTFSFLGPAFGAVAWWAHFVGFIVGATMALGFRPAAARRARRR
jgi:membrane associated rhomboid family serine protease